MSHTHAATDTLPIAAWSKGLNLRYQQLNSHWQQLLEQAGAETQAAGKLDCELLPDWLAEKLQKDEFSALCGHQTQAEDVLWPGAEDRFIRCFRQPQLDDSGELIGISGYALDVSEQYRLKNALKAQLERESNWLHALQSHALIITMDRQGRFTYISEPLAQLAGFSANELIGRDRQDTNLRPRGGQIVDYLTLAEQGMPVSFEFSGRGSDGKRLWMRSLVIALHAPSSLEQSFLEICTDLTAEKMAAVELENVNAKLLSVVSENNRLISQLEVAALTDPLTELPNRRALFERATQEQARLQRTGGVMSLIVIDIDHFKQINDSYGHETGDLALVQMARWGKDSLRSVDMLARTGGEEFVVLLPDTDLHHAGIVAERLRSKIAGGVLQQAEGGGEFQMTISQGLVQVEIREDIDTAIARADKALYAAKRAGRNCVKSD